MRWTAVGLTIGLALAVLTSRFAVSFLYGLSPTDPITFVTVSLLLGLVALIAAWLPARRASRIDPLIALRHD